MNRAIVLVCDSLGVGELPDAEEFGDKGSNTLGHVLESQHPKLPNLTRLGLLHTLPAPASSERPPENPAPPPTTSRSTLN